MAELEYDVKKDAKNVSDTGSSISSDEEQAIVKNQIEEESGHQIKYRSCSWQKVSCRLLFHESRFRALPSLPTSTLPSSFIPRTLRVVGPCVTEVC